MILTIAHPIFTLIWSYLFSSNTDKEAIPKYTTVHKNFSITSANLSHFDIKGFKQEIKTTFNIYKNTKNVNWGAYFLERPVKTTDVNIVSII